MLFGLTVTDGERRVEFDVVPTWRRHVLASGHQRGPGLDRQGGGSTRYHGTSAEESDIDSRSLLQVAQQGNDVICA